MSSRCLDRARLLAVIALVGATTAGCERESRDFLPPKPGAEVGNAKDADALQKETTNAALAVGRYEHNAYATSAGKRLWTWYNCSGCHGAGGGGGSGPALIDDVWIYGGDAGTIYQTIAYGRPNGMPAFASRIPKDQIWQLAAYVRSMAGLASADAAPNRDDAFLTRTPESFMDPQKPETVKPSGNGKPQ
jgi:cytochrome c oxidase cbb3-type subunit III